MPIVGGIAFDKLGTRNALIAFTAVVCVGQGIFMVAGYQKSFGLMLAGRVLFGIGCEAMIVGQSAITTAWFRDFELPMAMSIIICLPMLGTFLQGAWIPSVYEDSSFGWAFAIGFFMCLGSLALVILLSFIDKTTTERDNQLLDDLVDNIRGQAGTMTQDNKSRYTEMIKEHFQFSDFKLFTKAFWCTSLSCMFMQISIVNSIVIGSSVL